MKILALDLGKYKTVGCDYEGESGVHQFKKSYTTPAALQKLVQEVKPDRVVIEVCSIAGWVCDLLRPMGVEVQVANTSDDAWRWRKVKQKDDRRDALKIARLSAVNQLREVYIPQIEVRQWRALITYRQQLVRRRTKIKNHIRDLLLREGQILVRGSKCWNKLNLELLSSLAQPLAEVSMAELWRGELHEELQQLQLLQARIATVEEKLNGMGAADERVQLLRTIPGAQTGGSDRGAAGPAATISESESGEWLYWDGAQSAGLRGDGAAWSHHASRKSAGAFPASRSSLGGIAP